MLLKRIASQLPVSYQQALKRFHFGRLIRNGRFLSAGLKDREFDRLHEWVRQGDWVIDVGANVGNYTARLSTLVGPTGRVFAIEPVPDTFELIVANMARYPLRNVTLLNLAASDVAGVTSMTVPVMGGLAYPSRAHITGDGAFDVMALPLDLIEVPKRIALVKLDVEGHELAALRGMRALLGRDLPTLIVEGHSTEVEGFLRELGYVGHHTDGSANRVYQVQDVSPDVPSHETLNPSQRRLPRRLQHRNPAHGHWGAVHQAAPE